MTIEEILAGESKNVEFKVKRPEKSIKYMKSVVAFANGKGGRIVFGIDDHTRAVIGIPKDMVFCEMDAIANAISDSCEPVIVPDIYLQTIEGRTIIVVEISAGKQKPYYIKSEGITEGVYIRVSGTSRKADRAMTQEMYYESEGRSYDMVIRRDLKVSHEEIQKLCEELKDVALSNCRNEVQRKSVKNVTENVLLNWGILAEDEDGGIHPTNAYLFLTGQDVFLSKIQCGMFKGTTRGIFVDKRDYDGPLWKQVEDAFQFVLRNIRLGAKIEGVYRKDIYELPPESIRELMINAVMNCSFLQSSHIQVAIYDDRLEITTPGGLMPGVTVNRMKEGYSQIRNHALAHAFSYMNLIEGWGTGIPKLFREMREYGLREPEFEDMEIALRVNLYRSQTVPEPEAGIDTASRTDQKTSQEIETDQETYQKTSQEIETNQETYQETSQEIETALETNQETCQETSQEIETALKTDQEICRKTSQEIETALETDQKIRSQNVIKNKTQGRIICEIRKNPFVTQKQLMEVTGLSRSGVRYAMKKLQDRGLLERVGSTKKGQWVIKE